MTPPAPATSEEVLGEARTTNPANLGPAAPTPPRRAGRSTGPGSPRRAVLVILGIAVLLAAAILTTAVLRDDGGPSGGVDWFGTAVSPSRERPSFTLTDTEGRPFDFAAETAGQLTFLFFGYTSCPDICPAHLSTLTQALRAEPDLGARVVFVTTDPERDTPAALRAWLDGFSPSYVGLTGTPAQVAEAQRAAGVVPAVSETPDADGFYLVAHAAEILVVTPDDRVARTYPFGTRQADWAADLRRLRESGGGAP